MQTIAVARLPLAPYTRVLSDGPIAAAGHVAEDSIKQQLIRMAFRVAATDFDDGVDRRV